MDKSFDFARLLKNHEKNHKPKPVQFVSVEGGVRKRLQSNLNARRSTRLNAFDNLRNLDSFKSPARVSPIKKIKVANRRLQLEKWKQEKEARKAEEALRKKKPFIIGAAPKCLPPPPPPIKPSTSGRVTRSQTTKQNTIKQKTVIKEARSTKSFAPKNASFQAPTIDNLKTLPTLAPVTKKKDKAVYTFEPVLPNISKAIDNRSRGKLKKTIPKINVIFETQSSLSSETQSTNAIDMEFSTESQTRTTQQLSTSEINMSTKIKSPLNSIPKSESKSEEKLRSPKSPLSSQASKKISPCVTMSRGKDNARKEMKMKRKEGLLDEDASDMNDVNYFRQQLASEIKRINEMCYKWEKIQEETALSESIQELVLAAVGQARLLMSQKFEQFASLVERCAQPESNRPLVTPADLAGFWDMVFTQIENIDMRFKKLEELQKLGWMEEEPVEVKKKVAKVNVKKAVKPAGGPSRIREMIAAARKAKQEQASSLKAKSPMNGVESKTFEAGFFCVQSPVRSPIRSPVQTTPAAKTSLLKAVLSESSSFAMLRASLLSKDIEYEGIAPLPQTPLNTNATPGRSILKSSKKSSKKSIKVVLFQDINKENKDQDSRRKTLVRQNAITDEFTGVVTRSRVKSMGTPKDLDCVVTQKDARKRSSREETTLKESNVNVTEEKTIETPK